MTMSRQGLDGLCAAQAAELQKLHARIADLEKIVNGHGWLSEDDAAQICIRVMHERFGRVTFSEEEARILIQALMEAGR